MVQLVRRHRHAADRDGMESPFKLVRLLGDGNKCKINIEKSTKARDGKFGGIFSGMHSQESSILNRRQQHRRQNNESTPGWAGGDGDIQQKLCNRLPAS